MNKENTTSKTEEVKKEELNPEEVQANGLGNTHTKTTCQFDCPDGTAWVTTIL